MFVSTTESVPGCSVTQHLGIAIGNTVRSKHIGRDFMAGLKTIVGGEVRGYTEMLAEARQEAVNRMVEQAEQLGANAVVNVRFTTSAVMQGMAEMLAYGTAVRVDANSTSSPPAQS